MSLKPRLRIRDYNPIQTTFSYCLIWVYREPFLGSGAVLAALRPPTAISSDCFGPLIEIWQALRERPKELIEWYRTRYERFQKLGKPDGYEAIKADYNGKPNGPDLLFLCRSCYGGVMRFRKIDGYMSTPCGVHDPISPTAFSKRVEIWRRRTSGAEFHCLDFSDAFTASGYNDLIYCDPLYSDSQSIWRSMLRRFQRSGETLEDEEVHDRLLLTY